MFQNQKLGDVQLCGSLSCLVDRGDEMNTTVERHVREEPDRPFTESFSVTNECCIDSSILGIFARAVRDCLIAPSTHAGRMIVQPHVHDVKTMQAEAHRLM